MPKQRDTQHAKKQLNNKYSDAPTVNQAMQHIITIHQLCPLCTTVFIYLLLDLLYDRFKRCRYFFSSQCIPV